MESVDDIRDNWDEWCSLTAEIEKELGLEPFPRPDVDPDRVLSAAGDGTHSKYLLQRGLALSFWSAFTFANTRVGDDYELKTQEEEVERFCKHPFLDVGVLWNGDVTMCCMDYDAQLTVGNVNDTTLEAVMTSDAAADLRESMYSLHTLPEFCRQCQARPVLPGEDVSDAGPASSDQRAHCWCSRHGPIRRGRRCASIHRVVINVNARIAGIDLDNRVGIAVDNHFPASITLKMTQVIKEPPSEKRGVPPAALMGGYANFGAMFRVECIDQNIECCWFDVWHVGQANQGACNVGVQGTNADTDGTGHARGKICVVGPADGLAGERVLNGGLFMSRDHNDRRCFAGQKVHRSPVDHRIAINIAQQFICRSGAAR